MPRISFAKIRYALAITCLTALPACSKIDYHTADGSSGRFSDAHGKWLVVNYWAEWCKPCIEEMPELARFQQQNIDKVVVLTVNYDSAQGEQLQQQIDKLNIKLPVLLEDPAQQLGVQHPDALPTTFVFDPRGQLNQTLQGAQTLASLNAAIASEHSDNR